MDAQSDEASSRTRKKENRSELVTAQSQNTWKQLESLLSQSDPSQLYVL